MPWKGNAHTEAAPRGAGLRAYDPVAGPSTQRALDVAWEVHLRVKASPCPCSPCRQRSPAASKTSCGRSRGAGRPLKPPTCCGASTTVRCPSMCTWCDPGVGRGVHVCVWASGLGRIPVLTSLPIAGGAIRAPGVLGRAGSSREHSWLGRWPARVGVGRVGSPGWGCRGARKTWKEPRESELGWGRRWTRQGEDRG